MSLREAEAESGIAKDSLRKLIADCTLPAVELPGIRRVLIDRQDLNDLIERSKRTQRRVMLVTDRRWCNNRRNRRHRMKLTFRGWRRQVFAHNHKVQPHYADHGRWRLGSSDDALVWSSPTTAHGVVGNLGLSGDFRVEFQFSPEELRNWLKACVKSDPAAALRLAAEVQADAMIELASSARVPESENANK